RVRARAERDGERHGREHVSGVIFLVERLVADDCPSRCLDHFNIEAMLAVEPHGMRHDNRGGAGDWNESYLEILLLEGAALGERLRCGFQREKLRERSERSRSADRFEKETTGSILRKNGTHDGRGDDAFVALLLACDRDAC